IQPMTRPSLAIMRRREQAIDQLFVCLRALVLLELANFFRRRREPQKIEIGPPNQGTTICLARRGQFVLCQSDEHERVYRIPLPELRPCRTRRPCDCLSV